MNNIINNMNATDGHNFIVFDGNHGIINNSAKEWSEKSQARDNFATRAFLFEGWSGY